MLYGKMEKRIQEELFDVEVQYCDPDDCRYDCKNASDYRNSYMISLGRSKFKICKIYERRTTDAGTGKENAERKL